MLEEAHAVHAGHAHVGEDDVVRARFEGGDRLLGGRDVSGFVPALLEERREDLPMAASSSTTSTDSDGIPIPR